MTKSELFKAAHSLAKKFTGNYQACFALALKTIYKYVEYIRAIEKMTSNECFYHVDTESNESKLFMQLSRIIRKERFDRLEKYVNQYETNGFIEAFKNFCEAQIRVLHQFKTKRDLKEFLENKENTGKVWESREFNGYGMAKVYNVYTYGN